MKIRTRLKAGAGTCSEAKYESMLATCKQADGSHDSICVGEVHDACQM